MLYRMRGRPSLFGEEVARRTCEHRIGMAVRVIVGRRVDEDARRVELRVPRQLFSGQVPSRGARDAGSQQRNGGQGRTDSERGRAPDRADRRRARAACRGCGAHDPRVPDDRRLACARTDEAASAFTAAATSLD